MGLSDWFKGRGSADMPRVTMLTLLERRRMQRARRYAAVREAVERLFKSQRELLDAVDRDDSAAIEAAGRELALAEAELRLLQEMPGH